MSRPTPEDSAGSMFPFLAVLLCTMGAMVVLLGAMAHVAREKAAREAVAARETIPQEEPERLEQAQADLADAEEQNAKIEQARDDAARRLAEEQARLRRVEQSLRDLQREAEQLQIEARELAQLELSRDDDLQRAREEALRRKQLIEQREAEIEQLRLQAIDRPKRYAIVPLRDQVTGNRRPPIYLECVKRGVVLQPEGIFLPVEDLEFGEVSSPVIAADRAIRGYYQEHPEAFGGEGAGPPYSLLLVRPGGTVSKVLASKALESANVDFGQQLVSDEWELDYGEPNPELAERVLTAIEQQKNHKEYLQSAAPELFLKRGQRLASVRSAPTRSQPLPGSQNGRHRVSQAEARWNPFDELVEQARQAARSMGPTTGTGSPMAGATPRVGQGGPGDARTGLGSPPIGSPDQAELPQAAGDAQAASATNPPSDPNTTAQGPGGARNSGKATPAAQAQAAGVASKQAGSAQAAGAGAPSGSGGGSRRGRRSGKKPSGVPIQRMVHLRVSRGAVRLMPDEDRPSEEWIETPGATVSHLPGVAEALRDRARSWGIAGPGMRWSPVIVVTPDPGGDLRAAEIAALLDEAGLTVRRPPQTAQQPGDAHAPLQR